MTAQPGAHPRHQQHDPLPQLGLALVGLLAVYRLLVLAFGDIPMDVEEAYYLSWTDRLDFGYYSKPPMLAAILAAVTGLFGESLFVIKSISVVLHTATALVVYAIGRELYDARIGAVSAVVFQLLPITGMISLFTSTDAPLMLFWSLTLYGFIRAMRSEQSRWWLFTGVMAGLGLLSKYTMGVLAIGLLLFLITGPRRNLLWTPGLWLGLVAAVLVWSPNLLWLAQHDYITLTHTRQISGVETAAASLEDLGEFLVSQIVVFGPVLAIAFFFWIGRRTVWGSESNRLLLLASLPLLLVISLQAYLSSANMNWASPTYIGLSIVASAWMLQHARAWLIAGVVFNLLLLSLVYHYHAFADMAGIELSRKTDPYFKRLGWEEMGQQFRVIRQSYPDTPLLSADRKLLALLGYHGAIDGQRPALRSWNPGGTWYSQYDLANDLADYPEGEFLFLSNAPLSPAELQRFAESETLAVMKVEIYHDLKFSVHVYRVAGFKGYR